MNRYSLRNLLFLTLCCDLGLFSKRLISPAANILTDFLRIPGGIGTSFSLMFLVVAAELVPVFGCATLMSLVQSLIALSLGSIRHYWSGTVYCVDEFCVAREAQGQGIGTRFLAAVEKEAARRGAAALFLQTDRQMPAFAFYGKNGYRELGSHVSMKKTLERSETI